MKTSFLFTFAAFVLLAAGCEKQVQNGCADVSVHVNDFSITKEDYPASKATAIGSTTSVKAITLGFYTSAGVEQYKTTQIKDDTSTYTTFGEFSCSLPIGSYTLVILGYGHDVGDNLSLTSPTVAEYTSGRVWETFAATQAVNVTTTEALDLTATLDRIVAKLNLVSTDGVAANVQNIRMTFASGGKVFNPTSGLATATSGFSNTVGVSSSVGQTTSSVSYVLLNTDEQTMNVTIETLDSGGNTLFSKVVENVPFQRNHITRLTGAMYSADASAGSFQVNNSYSDDINSVNF